MVMSMMDRGKMGESMVRESTRTRAKMATTMMASGRKIQQKERALPSSMECFTLALSTKE